MKPEITGQSRTMIVILSCAAVGVILLLALAIRSLVVFSGEPKQAEAARALAAVQAPAPAPEGEAPASGHIAPGHEAASVPEQAPVPALRAQVPKKTSEFVVDYRTSRAREEGRKAMIETLRQQARENPESGSSLSEERIKRLEQSGNSPQ